MARRLRLLEGADEEASLSRTGTVLRLTERAAADPAQAGAKAAALARATSLGLPVLPGAVLSTAGAASRAEADGPLRRAWEQLTRGGRVLLAVRSSSTVEDSTTSSMAGQFTSVLDVDGWPATREAVDRVLASADGEPMAVLLQPMLDAVLGGVLFGVDPVTGRDDRILVECVAGGPAPLVSGLVSGSRHLLTRRGRLLETDQRQGPTALRRAQRHALTRLAAAAAEAFGGPQDIEWAFDRDGTLWLLQSRPVTASGARAPRTGPVYGPGPVAETLPEALSPLEEDLWATPIRTGILGALEVVGVAPASALRESPVLLVVGGRVAVDLELLGVRSTKRGLLERLDPRPPARRLGASWRVGRLARALPALAEDVVREVDAQLASVPALPDLDDATLLRLLERSRETLHGVHGHEVVAGILGLEGTTSAAAAALAAVRRGRSEGRPDAEIVAEWPVTLALSPPRIGRDPMLPPVVAETAALMGEGLIGPREALRVRARWLQELAARSAAELGQRLHDRGLLPSAESVRHLRLDELVAVVSGAAPPAELEVRAAVPVSPPLPASFRLGPDGTVHAVAADRRHGDGGRGAGGGRGSGPVHHLADGPPPRGSVLVVTTLDPDLAGHLPGLAGVVAETGSVLSHLAILARELGVPTVVGVPDAVDRFDIGARLLVDGTTGEVALVQEAGA